MSLKLLFNHVEQENVFISGLFGLRVDHKWQNKWQQTRAENEEKQKKPFTFYTAAHHLPRTPTPPPSAECGSQPNRLLSDKP